MLTKEKKTKLMELTNQYRFAFYLMGAPDTGYNKLRIASFISTKKPREYEIFIEDAHKTLVFWNPYDKDSVQQS